MIPFYASLPAPDVSTIAMPPRPRIALFIVLASAAIALAVVTALQTPSGPVGTISSSPTVRPSIVATVETDPVPHSRDAADDPVIWVHPSDPAASTIIGTDKKGGIGVYDLTGRQLQYIGDRPTNNVDLRSGVSLGDELVSLVTATVARTDSIVAYRVDVETRSLVEDGTIRTGISPQGLCMYRSARSGKLYAVAVGGNGNVEQWELFAAGGGQVDARQVRSFRVGGKSEGCVADDELGYLYVSEELEGIWRYGAEPDAGTSRTLVDRTGPGGHLVADVEGLTIAYGPNGTGYLIASSQGDNTFAIYRREVDNAYLGSFEIRAGDVIDNVTDTDGIDVTTTNLGPAFPGGLFVAQDGSNDDGNQNFKLVPWERIIGG